MKYRKKPVVIEAYQTDKDLDIETLEGTMHASAGDYIITGVRGEQYPCKPDIFKQTYEPADTPTIDAVPVAVFDRIIEELELHMYRIEGQDDLLYPLTPRQMTMNSTFEIAIDVVERIRQEQTDVAD